MHNNDNTVNAIIPHDVSPQDIAHQIVADYVNSTFKPEGNFEIFSVWFCYILGGWKALVSTTLSDGMYYEVTYNTNKNEAYLDAYSKVENWRITINA